MGKRYGMTSNVVEVDPNHYGSRARLPGVLKDEANWTALFNKLSIDHVVRKQNTTKRDFLDGFKSLSLHAEPGDLVVIQHSGHGTPIRDTSGDEADGMDEAVCLFDGLLVDDRVWDLFSLFKPDVQVLCVFDTCHSGTSFRSMLADRLESMNPIDTSADSLNCELLYIGTAQDEQTAADTRTGGAGSQALIATRGLADDYRDWVNKAQRHLRLNRFEQRMQLNEINADRFVHQRPFELAASLPTPGDPFPGAQPTTVTGVTIHYSDGTTEVKGSV